MAKGAPAQIEPRTLGDYLEVMSKAVFQSGMSWAVIDKKWPGTRDAFREFEPLAVASLTEAQMAELTADTRIIRNRKKVEAVVDNARRMIDLDEAHKGFPQVPALARRLRGHGGRPAQAVPLPGRDRLLLLPVGGEGRGAGLRHVVRVAAHYAYAGGGVAHNELPAAQRINELRTR